MSGAQQEEGFAIPGSKVPDYRLHFVVLVIILLIDGLASGFHSSTFITFALIAVALWFASWYLTGYKIIHLSPRGMRGQGSWGEEVKLAWDEPVVIGSDVYANLPAFTIRNRDHKNGILIFPRVIAQLPEFQDALRQFAPPDHALVAAVEHLKANARLRGDKA